MARTAAPRAAPRRAASRPLACRPRAAAAASRPPPAPASCTAPAGAALPELLHAARHAAAAAGCPASGERTLSGAGEALGLPTRWALRCDADTLSYHERVTLSGPRAAGDVQLRCGYDAAAGAAWQTDLSGACVALQGGDDARDRALLLTWLRTGAWVAAAERGALLATPAAHTPAAGGDHVLDVALPGSPLAARLWLRAAPGACVPRRAELRANTSGAEAWEWTAWPRAAVHTQPTGERSVYNADAGAADEDAAAPLALLAQLPLPQPAAPFAAADVPAARCGGGQFLLRGALGGAPPQWFALDTACDGSAVVAASADAAQLPSLGRAAVPGVGGALVGALRRGPLSVGPLTLPSDTCHLELSLDGALQPPDASPLGGVLGASLLRRCVLELRAPRRTPGGRDAPRVSATLHAPGAYAPPDRVAVAWQALTFIDGAPHVRASYRLDEADAAPREGLFRLALGVGGAGVVLCAAEAAACGFAERTAALQPRGLVAAPGEARARLAAVTEGALLSGRVAALRLGDAGASFAHVRCLLHVGGDPPDLALSHRAAGLLCADLFRGVALVLDYARARCAVVTLQPDGRL
jgi:hypothetical protein